MSDSKTLLIHLLIKLGLIDSKFFGKIRLDFENGKVVHYVVEKSGKL